MSEAALIGALASVPAAAPRLLKLGIAKAFVSAAADGLRLLRHV